MIQYLDHYSTYDTRWRQWIYHPTEEDIIDKINEIIRELNLAEELRNENSIDK